MRELRKLGPSPFSMQGKARKEGTCGVPYARFGKNPGYICMYAQQLSDEFTDSGSTNDDATHWNIWSLHLLCIFVGDVTPVFL